MSKHKVDYRVYYEDTDAGGVVYYARYLHFAERGRTELLRDLGYENQKLHDEQGLVFVVRNVDIHFIKPARLDDMLSVHTSISEIKNSSFVMNQHIMRGDVFITDINVLLVCVEVKDFKPVRMPAVIKEAFLKYQ
ncbi:MAG: tol-pal system-associated acyl-CoA thioesterase [Alphaproteobacteria bacterium]|nr:tol-pal system-associated acyl-CoA thioesterase [Alphaproteobacteria bacterium]